MAISEFQSRPVPQEVSANVRHFLDEQLSDIEEFLRNVPHTDQDEIINGSWKLPDDVPLTFGTDDDHTIDYDSASDQLQFNFGAGSTVAFREDSVAGFIIDGGSNFAGVRGGYSLRVYDSANADYVDISHDGTDLIFDDIGNNTDLVKFKQLQLWVEGGSPTLHLYETDGAVDEKLWDIIVTSENFQIRTRTDADGTGLIPFRINRGVGTAIATMTMLADRFQFTDQDDSTIRFDIDPDNDLVWVRDGQTLRISDSADSDHLDLYSNTTRSVIARTEPGDLFLLPNDAFARSGIIAAETAIATDEATVTVDLNGLDGGFVFIVASSTSAAETGNEGAFFYFSGTTMIDIASGGTVWSLGSGSNPNIDNDHNVWRSADGILSIKNRRGSSRYYSVYVFAGA